MEQVTQLWLGGVAVDFVRWTDRGLIYTSLGSHESLTSLSKGMVRRMIRDGLLRIEGYCPEWGHDDPNSRIH